MGNSTGNDTSVPARSVARLLKKLLPPTAILVPVAGSLRDNAGTVPAWAVQRTDRGASGTARYGSDLVSYIRCRGLIEKGDTGQWRLNESGRAWLKRYMSGADPFQEQHRVVARQDIEVSGERVRARINVSESPLAWLRQRSGRNGAALIDDAQFAAGERLRFDFTRAMLSPRVTADWGAVADPSKRRSGEAGSVADMMDSAIEAGRRFNRAMQAVGPELSDILVDVCCFLKGLEETEKKYDWPRRSAKLLLQMALTRLARHYGLANAPVAKGAGGKGLRHWGEVNYRPRIVDDE